MPEDSRQAHLAPIFQQTAATAVSALCPLAFSYCWHFFLSGNPPGWVSSPQAGLIAAPVLPGLLIIGKSYFARRRHPKIASPEGGRISVYVARLVGDDAHRTHQRDLIQAIASNLIGDANRSVIEVIDAGIELHPSSGVSYENEAAAAKAKALKLLRKRRADLFIWGLVHRGGIQVELHFVAESFDTIRGERFSRTDNSILFESRFISVLGTALATIVLATARPTTDDARDYALQKFNLLSEGLKRLMLNPPAGLSSLSRAEVTFAYALTQGAIYDRSKD